MPDPAKLLLLPRTRHPTPTCTRRPRHRAAPAADDAASLTTSIRDTDSVACRLGRRGLGGYGTHRRIKTARTRETQVLSTSLTEFGPAWDVWRPAFDVEAYVPELVKEYDDEQRDRKNN
ncbi:hypothetical protein PENPOL_c003G10598 [Penicillium polonicum]|uniref:Uncharacterized protein n=1 Tax=Penicillium polonicum TaxID=60169 RepID=A0A1V6NT62_PENPO|nr:hypothetical protein PENPOL_c003G10598 [Penicillium polonicum]